MLQAMMQQNMLLYGIGILMFLGAASQIWLWGIYGRMTKDMENERMAKGKFIKQIRQRYALQKRMGDGNINTEVFIERNLYQYRILGRTLHQWRRMGAFALAVIVTVGVFGWYASGNIQPAAGNSETYLWAMGIAALVTGVVYGITDIGYKREYLKTGLLDMLENGGSSIKNFSIQENSEAENGKEKHKKLQRVETAAATAATPKSGRLALRKGKKVVQSTKAQKDKQELKENLTRIKASIGETAAGIEKEKNAEILKNMDPKEQERIIREVLKEFLLESGE